MDGDAPTLDVSTLWRRFSDELVRFAKSRGLPAAAAQDLVQTAFLRAHRALADGTVPDNPRAWLYQIVRRLIVDAHRSEQSAQRLEQRLAHLPSDEDEAHETGAVDDETWAVVARTLPWFIAQLPAESRDALRLVELEGLTQREAAARLGVPLSTLKSRVQRGRKKLRALLEGCCAFEQDARGKLTSCTPKGQDAPCC